MAAFFYATIFRLLGRRHTHIFKMVEMSLHRTQESFIFIIRKVKFLSRFTNDLCNFRIMYVIYRWE
jgi:hypothetical protein